MRRGWGAALLGLSLAACDTSPATGELGRARFGFCDLAWFPTEGVCHGTTPLAAGAEALLFVAGSDGLSFGEVVSDDPTLAGVSPTDAGRDVFVVTAHRPGTAMVAVHDGEGVLLDRLPISVRDVAAIRVLHPAGQDGAPVPVPAGGERIHLGYFGSSGEQLGGIGALDVIFEDGVEGERTLISDLLQSTVERTPVGQIGGDYLDVRGPVSGGEGRVLATAPSGASLEVVLDVARARVLNLFLSIADTSADQARVAAWILLEAERTACCEWAVEPVGGPITIRRELCDELLLESAAIGERSTAQARCTVLDWTQTIEVAIGP